MSVFFVYFYNFSATVRYHATIKTGIFHLTFDRVYKVGMFDCVNKSSVCLSGLCLK